MDKNRLFVIGAALAIAVIVLFGWTVGVQPQLAAAVAADQESKAVQVKNAASADVLAGLKKDFANLGQLKKQRDDLRKAVPSGHDMSAFIGEIHSLEVGRGVTLTSLTVTDGQAYVPPKSAAPAAATKTAAPAPSPAATTPPAPDGFIVMPIQLSVTGPYVKVLDFVQGMQTGTRLVLVTAFSSSAAGPSKDVTASIGGFAYVLSGP